MIKNYKVRLHVLSPIHIGMGDAYDPTQFVFDKDGHMWVFDTNDYLKSLSSEKSEEFCKLAANSSNPIPVFGFFRDNFNKDKIKCRQVKASSDLFQRYEEILAIGSLSKDAINQFELKRTISNPIKNVPYIPGSSIKGCLKTLWMSEINRCSDFPIVKSPDNARFEKNIEKNITGGAFARDPFRFVKVSDFYPIEKTDNLTMMMYAVMFPKTNEEKENFQKAEKRNSLTVALEVIPKGVDFEGIISFNDQCELPESAKLKPISIAGIQQKSKFYYYKHQENPKDKDSLFIPSKMLNEASWLNEKGVDISFAKKIIECFKNKQLGFPIRIGHHSSAEFITIDNCRSIRITPQKVKPPKYSDTSTNIWLASSRKKPDSPKNLQAFGWAMLEFEEMK